MSQRGQHPIRRFFASRLFLLVMVPVALLVALGYARAYYNGYKINQEIAALQEEIKTLEKKKLESIEVLQYVMSDGFVEEKARTELNMKRPGENVLVVQSKKDYPEEIRKGDSPTARQRISNPVKWWYYFTRQDLPAEQ